LKVRVLLWFGTVVASILIIFGLSFGYFLNQSIDANIKTKLHNNAVSVWHDFTVGNTLNINLPKNTEAAILNKENIIYHSKGLSLKQIHSFLKNKKDFYLFENKENDETVDAVYLWRMEETTVLLYKKEIDNKIENFEDTLLVLDPVLFLLLMLAASRLVDKILLPIKSMTKTAQNISVNHFNSTIEIPKNNDEIKGLVLEFNTMIERLKKGVDNLDRFNADVSHELKTPLTVIKGEVEVALRKPRSPEEYAKILKTISYEADQIEQITQSLLMLTRYSSDNIKETFELCHLDAIILNVIQKQERTIKNKQLSLNIQRLEHITTHSSPLLLHAIFANLIDNAVKYTPEGRIITLSLYRDNGIHFIIEDEGVGMTKEELSKSTERFYRVDNARSKTIKGFGLGLSLVKHSVSLLDGEMKISSALGKGTVAHVSFS
jgi:signal transduction histidine kinase